MPDETSLIARLNGIFAEMGRKTSNEYASNFKQSYRDFAAVRHRFTEDLLTQAMGRGVSQYVILGAGLDSFAYRRPDLEVNLQVFEVDLPAPQEWKKTLLQRLNITPPRNISFVPVDLETNMLFKELSDHGYDKGRPAFFSWLGVTQYLTKEAVFNTLGQVASAVSASEIFFEYVLTDSLLAETDRHLVLGGKSTPEPWISQFDTADLEKHLREMGFGAVADFGPENWNRLYFNERKDQLSRSALELLNYSVLRIDHFMSARVG